MLVNGGLMRKLISVVFSWNEDFRINAVVQSGDALVEEVSR